MSIDSRHPRYTGPPAPKLFEVARWAFPFAWGGLVVGMGGPWVPALLGVFGLLLLELVSRGPPRRC